MNIRKTRDEDLPAILELIHEFHEESLDEYGIFCNDEVLNRIMPAMVKTSLVMLDTDKIVGVIAGFKTSHIQDDKKLFQETIWYVSKKYRKHGIKLLNEMERLCKHIGCVYMVMVNMGTARNELFKKFYTSNGYSLLETQYIKTLEV